MEPHAVARALLLWIGVIGGVLLLAAASVGSEHDDDNTVASSRFFTAGPNSQLVLLGVPIHTWPRYMGVVVYTLGSTCFRTLHSEVLSPWIVTRVQTTDAKSKYAETHAVTVVMTSVVFTWLDWFMYLNILLAQLDFLVVEVLGNVVVTLYITHSYMRGGGGRDTEYASLP